MIDLDFWEENGYVVVPGAVPLGIAEKPRSQFGIFWIWIPITQTVGTDHGVQPSWWGFITVKPFGTTARQKTSWA